MKSILFIDGENFKGKAKEIFKEDGRLRPEWYTYDFRGLFDRVLGRIKIDEKIFYFARLKEYPQTREKSKQLIEEQRLLKTHLEKQGFKVVFAGRVRRQNDDKNLLIFKEKGVDVKIAVDMVIQACDGKLKEALICSSDSDLQPAITELTKREIKTIYIGFENKPNKGLTYTTDKTILIRNSELFEFEKTLF
ncbi:MAG: NYN domain-containing protein [Patescibacteria group bacterium]